MNYKSYFYQNLLKPNNFPNFKTHTVYLQFRLQLLDNYLKSNSLNLTSKTKSTRL